LGDESSELHSDESLCEGEEASRVVEIHGQHIEIDGDAFWRMLAAARASLIQVGQGVGFVEEAEVAALQAIGIARCARLLKCAASFPGVTQVV
jgi:hypothetical protein